MSPLIRIVLAELSIAAILTAQTGDRPPSVSGASTGALSWLTAPYTPRHVNAVDPNNTPRIYELLRAGNIYLSLQDAIALAIENNLGTEAARYAIPAAETDTLRAKGGGTLRGVGVVAAELPAGVGGPASPLINGTATGAPPATAVPGNIFNTGFLQGSGSSLALDPSLTSSPLPSAAGPPIPQYDPAITGSLFWSRQTMPEASSFVTGSNVLVTKSLAANLGLQQGFSTGTQYNVSYTSTWQNSSSAKNSYNPSISGSLGLTVTQPLLRGFGRAMNRRWIRIAKNDEKISDLVFRQGLINLVYGISLLYYDLASLTDDLSVKRETLASARELLKNTQAGIDEGTLARVELTRSQAEVAGAEQDVINAEGLLEQQEALMKTILTRKGSREPLLQSARLIVTDSLMVPAADQTPPLRELLEQADQYRPDLAAAGLEITNSRIALEGTRNQLLPQLDLMGVVQSQGLAGTPAGTAAGGSPDTTLSGGYGTLLEQLLAHRYPTYEIGIQLNLPLRNRVSQADATRDELALRTSQTQRIQLQNQVALEIDSAAIALRRARAAYDAAVRTRGLQEESLDVERARYEAGVDTIFFVIQYQAYLSQARSTEVVAKGDYFKSLVGLQRAVGNLLDLNHISTDEAYRGHLSSPPAALPAPNPGH
ncbi:MAG TPA: TolC family protein [Bryobacteraceae bacterium]